MRYIIIPAFIIGYLYWTYSSVKDIYTSKKDSIGLMEEYTLYWIVLHGIALLSFIIYIIIEYW